LGVPLPGPPPFPPPGAATFSAVKRPPLKLMVAPAAMFALLPIRKTAGLLPHRPMRASLPRRFRSPWKAKTMVPEKESRKLSNRVPLMSVTKSPLVVRITPVLVST
jgi:hypothetical protein